MDKDLGEINEENEKVLSEANENDSGDKVKYETFKRVLDQKKKSDDTIASLKEEIQKLSEFKEQSDRLQEEKLKEEGNWKALLEQREKKLEEYRSKFEEVNSRNEAYEKDISDMIKINAFRTAIGGNLKKDDYYSFVDTSKIAINPETGAIDTESLNEYANEFTNNFKELIDFNSSKLPNSAPKGNGSLTYEQWLKLPLAEKRKRQKDVKL